MITTHSQKLDRPMPNMASDSEEIKSFVDSSYLGAKELAQQIGIHPKTLSKWARDGLINAIKISPRVVVYDRLEVKRFIDSFRRKHIENS